MSGLFTCYAKWIPNFSEKVGPLLHSNAFSLSKEAVTAFKTLKEGLCNASLGSIQVGVLFEIKNAKILSWRLELSQLNHGIRHEPGACKVAHDACLARVLLSPICLSANCTNLSAILDTLDFTTLFGNAICPTPERRQTVFRLCRTCAEIKPCFLSRLFKLRSRL